MQKTWTDICIVLTFTFLSIGCHKVLGKIIFVIFSFKRLIKLHCFFLKPVPGLKKQKQTRFVVGFAVSEIVTHGRNKTIFLCLQFISVTVFIPCPCKALFLAFNIKMRCLREPEASWFIPGSWRWVIYSWWGMKRLHVAEPAANGGIARGRWSNWGMGRWSCWPVYSPGVSQYSGHVWSWLRMTDNPKKKKKKSLK